MIASTDASILVAQHGTDNSTVECRLLPNKANRHGLITGATGTGKTITLQTMAEGFSRLGVPVFMADIKGDLTGISQGGSPSPKLSQIIKERGLPDPTYQAFPTTLWDVFGEQGHPVRATVSDLGPLLLSRMLNLNETQAGVLQLVFKIADDNGLLLLDMKDLRAMCQDVGDNASQYTTEYGNISAASIGAIQRGLMQIEAQGGAKFFGEPMLNIADFMQTDARGQGMVNILAADKLMNAPRLYATFLLWLLSELFETLPEVGDLEKPICCSTTRPRSCWNASSWWCAWCAARAWACISSRKTRWTFPTRCWHNWATACSTPCAPSRHATRRPSSPPPIPCAPTRGWTLASPLPNWRWVRPW